MMATAKTPKKAATKKPAAQPTETPVQEVATPVAEAPEVKQVFRPTEIDGAMLIPVRSGYHGMLVYVSSRTGEKFEWDEFGGEQDIELRELRNMRNTHKGFFANNWVLFDEEYAWVLDYLGVSALYKNALTAEQFDTVFEMAPAEAAKVISKLSVGQKRSLAYRARVLIAEEKIDSMKLIHALEDALDTTLVER